MSEHSHDHDLGFLHDLPQMLGRRRFLTVVGSAGVMVSQAAAMLKAVALPWETAGPYPADGSNALAGKTLNVLTEEGVVREDLRSSFGACQGTAEGVRLDLELVLEDAADGSPLARHALYLWACDAVGEYSLYNVTNQNYLRGVGVADERGVVRFTTLFPGCYNGRWPHFHFEIFATIEAAVSGRASVLTAQIALPEATCHQVYRKDERYGKSEAHLERITLATDNVFSDNTEAQIQQQTLALSGSPTEGYEGKLVIPVDFTAERRASRPPRPLGGRRGDRPPGPPPGRE